ncbi:MAG: helix-turn-helix transcriptional regulator [Oscillospiraceae bacterium]|nr:helix-turn-helix transcriptional regulator [Oscillospiraceae bacterium]
MDRIKIGEFLRQLRKESGLTQEELSEKFGVSSRSVSRWENGSTMPELGILVDLADYYRIDIRELIDGERKNETMNNETKEVLKSAADYAEQEKKLTVRRKCIVTLVGTIAFALCIFLGAALLPTLPDTIGNTVDKAFYILGFGGVFLLWVIVTYKSRKNRK